MVDHYNGITIVIIKLSTAIIISDICYSAVIINTMVHIVITIDS